MYTILYDISTNIFMLANGLTLFFINNQLGLMQANKFNKSIDVFRLLLEIVTGVIEKQALFIG